MQNARWRRLWIRHGVHLLLAGGAAAAISAQHKKPERGGAQQLVSGTVAPGAPFTRVSLAAKHGVHRLLCVRCLEQTDVAFIQVYVTLADADP